MGNPLLKFFAFTHLPPSLAEISKPFSELAHRMDDLLPEGEEKNAMMRKLLEAKDCAVRSLL